MSFLSLASSRVAATSEISLTDFRPSYPLSHLLLAGLLVFSPLFDGGTTHVAVMIVRFMILTLLGLYLWHGVRAGVLSLPQLPIAGAVFAYIGLATLSTALSPYFHQSLQWLIVLLSYAALVYVLVSLFHDWDHVAKLVAVVVSMGLLEAGLALLEAARPGTIRPNGTFFNPNFLAGYLAAISSVVLSGLCHVRLRSFSKRRAIYQTAALAGILAVLLLAIMQTGSRGGVLALLVGVAIVTGARFGRWAVGILLAIVILGGLIVPNPLRARLQLEHAVNPLGYARVQIWQSSMHEIVDHPFGIGLGLYQYGYPQYAFPVEGQITRYGKMAQTAHNEYVQMGVELGVLSVAIFLWGMVVLSWTARARLAQRLNRRQRAILVGVSAGVASILAQAAVDSNLHEPAIAILLVFYAAIILAASRLSQSAAPAHSVAIPRRWQFLSAVTTAALVAVLMVGIARLGLGFVAYDHGTRAHARGDFPSALSYYQTAILLDGRKALYHSSLAAVHFGIFQDTRDLEAAKMATGELRTAIELNPLDGRLYGLLGHVYEAVSTAPAPVGTPSDWKRSWLRSAVLAYERAEELEPFNAFHSLELSRLHSALGDRIKAQAKAKEAVQLEPNFLAARGQLIKLYLRTGDLSSAAQEYGEIMDRYRRYGAWLKDTTDERLLNVDFNALRTALHAAKRLT